jgi:hypothetical protein
MNIHSLKMNHLISQEQKEIQSRKLANMLREARAFQHNEFRTFEYYQKLTMASSFFIFDKINEKSEK